MKLARLGLFLTSALLLAGCGPLVKTATITQIVQNGATTHRGFLAVGYGNKAEKQMFLSAAIDWNGNGTMEDNEWIIKSAAASPRSSWNGNFPLELAINQKFEHLKGKIVLSPDPAKRDVQGSETFDLAIAYNTYDIGDLIDMSTVTRPNDSMKGDTVERVPAPAKPEGMPNNLQNDTPDITQHKDECAPTSAANSFIRLAGEHGRIDALPRDPYELVGKFKDQMGWTFQNGVTVGDFSPGKDFVAKQLGLPIHSETLQSDDFNRILDRFEETINGGGAAEMRIQSQVTDAKGKLHNVGGHMVTVTNVIRTGQSVSVQVNDPLSPLGTETYDIDPNTGALIKYPFLGGKESEAVRVVIKAGFFQTWVEPEERSIIDDLEPTSRTKVKVIVSQGKKIPLSEVYVEDPGQCGANHYHAVKGGTAKALDGTMVPDAAPMHCGYGKVDETPVEDCTLDGSDCTPVKFTK